MMNTYSPSIFQSTPLAGGETRVTVEKEHIYIFQSTPLAGGETLTLLLAIPSL